MYYTYLWSVSNVNIYNAWSQSEKEARIEDNDHQSLCIQVKLVLSRRLTFLKFVQILTELGHTFFYFYFHRSCIKTRKGQTCDESQNLYIYLFFSLLNMKQPLQIMKFITHIIIRINIWTDWFRTSYIYTNVSRHAIKQNLEEMEIKIQVVRSPNPNQNPHD